jgi:serine/threonine-protein kinase
MVRDLGLWPIHLSMFLRAALCGSALALARSRASLSLKELRAVEVVLFGGLTVLLMTGQYFGNMEYIRRGDLISMVAYEKNGIIQIAAAMMLYAVLIPNEPKRTAWAVMTMALGPILVFGIALERYESAQIAHRMTAAIHAGSNVLYIAFVTGLAVYSTHVLNRLHRQLHEARKFGQYQLGVKLGSGGMGEVYLAEHQLLKRPCALKLIKPDIQANPVALARFEREVRSAARLSNPHVVEIYDYGHADDGTFYYVMEYLAGLSLHDLVSQFGPLPPGRAIYLARQVCSGLAEAHAQGLVHRDLKPANIFVAIRGGEYDVVKILDFGLVKLAPGEGADLTADHTVSGTPMFMSPEQATGRRDLDGRSDLYALGAILYYMLTGRAPFEGDSAMAVMIAHVRDPVVPPSRHRPGIPADLEEVILHCLAKSSEARFPDARSLARVLASCAPAGEWNADRAAAWWYQQAEKAAPPPEEEIELTTVQAL